MGIAENYFAPIVLRVSGVPAKEAELADVRKQADSLNKKNKKNRREKKIQTHVPEIVPFDSLPPSLGVESREYASRMPGLVAQAELKRGIDEIQGAALNAASVEAGAVARGRKARGMATVDAIAKAMEGLTPIEYLLDMMRAAPPEGLTLEQRLFWETRRLEAAKIAAPYVHPRLAAMEVHAHAEVSHEDALNELDD